MASLLGTLLHWHFPSQYVCVESDPPTRQAFSFGTCVNLARGCCSCAYFLPKMQPLALIALRTAYRRMCVMQAARILKCTSAGLTYLPIVFVCFLMSWMGSGAPLGFEFLNEFLNECKEDLNACLLFLLYLASFCCVRGCGWARTLHAWCSVIRTHARMWIDLQLTTQSSGRLVCWACCSCG